MQEETRALLRALVPVAWADGEFKAQEQEMLEALLDAYEATPAERDELRAYAKERRTLDDIELQELSAATRRVLLQHAVLLSFVDGEQNASESKLVAELAHTLRIGEVEAAIVIQEAQMRARRHLALLA
jgi:tellurite resistance protein